MNCESDDCPHPEHAGLTGELDETEYTPYEPVAMEFNGCQDPDCDGEY